MCRTKNNRGKITRSRLPMRLPGPSHENAMVVVREILGERVECSRRKMWHAPLWLSESSSTKRGVPRGQERCNLLYESPLPDSSKRSFAARPQRTLQFLKVLRNARVSGLRVDRIFDLCVSPRADVADDGLLGVWVVSIGATGVRSVMRVV